MHIKNDRFSRGVTLIELLITVGVLAVVAAIAIPNFRVFFDKQEVIGAAEELYSVTQQARVEALSRSQSIYLSFATDDDTDWRYGMSFRPNCDPSITDVTDADACILIVSDGDANLDTGDGTVDSEDLMLMVYDSGEHRDVTLDIIGSGATAQLEFSSMRGIVENAWGASPYSLEFASGEGKRLRVRVGKLGQVRVCTPDDSVGGYETC